MALLLCAVAASTAPQIHLVPRPLVSTSPQLLRLRGGGKQEAAMPPPSGSAVLQARLLVLLSGVIYGTYPVILRALKVVGGAPLPAVFVTCVRYLYLTLFAFTLKGFRMWQARMKPPEPTKKKPPPQSSLASSGPKMWWSACELALLTAVSSVISIWGVSRVSAVTSEILGSTLHVFVPLLTLGLVGGSSFGMNTWLGCLLAFVAAVISCLADNTDAVASGGGGGGGKDYAGQFAVVLGTFVFGWNRVRTQVLLRGLEAEALNTARMMLMGLFSICFIVIDVIFNENGSRQTLTKLHEVVPAQWGLLCLSVFLSAFVASTLQFRALRVISAANAQPFMALQPLFAAGWSKLCLSEPISNGALVGGTLMIGATLLACTDKTDSTESGKEKKP